MVDEGTEQQGLDAGAEVGEADQSAEAQVGDSGQAAQPEQAYEIERNGQVVKVPYSEAKDYVSKGYDYTQKTQELARERASLAPYQEMATYLQSNPDKAQAIYNMLSQEQDPVQQKMAHLESVTNQLIQQNSQEKLNGMLDKIRNDEKYEGLFKDTDMEELMLATALQTKRTDFDGLKGVADKIHSKWLKSSVESERKGSQKVIQNLNSPTRKGETGKGTFVPPKDFDPAKASWKEISQRAVEML